MLNEAVYNNFHGVALHDTPDALFFIAQINWRFYEQLLERWTARKYMTAYTAVCTYEKYWIIHVLFFFVQLRKQVHVPSGVDERRAFPQGKLGVQSLWAVMPEHKELRQRTKHPCRSIADFSHKQVADWYVCRNRHIGQTCLTDIYIRNPHCLSKGVHLQSVGVFCTLS